MKYVLSFLKISTAVVILFFLAHVILYCGAYLMITNHWYSINPNVNACVENYVNGSIEEVKDAYVKITPLASIRVRAVLAQQGISLCKALDMNGFTFIEPAKSKEK